MPLLSQSGITTTGDKFTCTAAVTVYQCNPNPKRTHNSAHVVLRPLQFTFQPLSCLHHCHTHIQAGDTLHTHELNEPAGLCSATCRHHVVIICIHCGDFPLTAAMNHFSGAASFIDSPGNHNNNAHRNYSPVTEHAQWLASSSLQLTSTFCLRCVKLRQRLLKVLRFVRWLPTCCCCRYRRCCCCRSAPLKSSRETFYSERGASITPTFSRVATHEASR